LIIINVAGLKYREVDILPAMNNEDSSGAALKGCTELVPAAGAPRGSAHFTG